MYEATTIYPDGYTISVCSLTFAAAIYFKRMMQLRGAAVTIKQMRVGTN